MAHHIGHYQFPALVALAYRVVGIAVGHPFYVFPGLQHLAACLLVRNQVAPCGTSVLMRVIGRSDEIAPVVRQVHTIHPLARHYVFERVETGLPRIAYAHGGIIAAHCYFQRILFSFLREVLDDHVVGLRLQYGRRPRCGRFAVDVDAYVLHLSCTHLCLGVVAVVDGEVEQMQCGTLIASRCQHPRIGRTVCSPAEVGGRVEHAVFRILVARESYRVYHHRPVYQHRAGVPEICHLNVGGEGGGRHGSHRHKCNFSFHTHFLLAVLLRGLFHIRAEHATKVRYFHIIADCFHNNFQQSRPKTSQSRYFPLPVACANTRHITQIIAAIPKKNRLLQ